MLHQNELLDEDKQSFEQKVEKRTAELTEANQELAKNIKKIDQLRSTDYLTSVYNRYKSETELVSEMARSKRYHSPLFVALFDIDKFKNINDTYGHQNGDMVLPSLSLVIRFVQFISEWI